MRRWIGILFVSVGFSVSSVWAQDTNNQDTKNKSKLWPFKVEGFANMGNARPSFNFSPEVYVIPAKELGRSFSALNPPIPTSGLMNFSFGINVHPLPTRILNPLIIGYSVNFYGSKNDFRSGPFLSRIGYPNGENAFTYTRLSRFGPSSTFRMAYDIPLGQLKEGEETIVGTFLEIGPQCTTYNHLAVTQGRDTFNTDRVYRQTNGRGRACGGAINLKIIDLSKSSGFKWGIRFGVGYEKGYMEFPDFPGRRPFSKISIVLFGMQIGF